MESLLFAAILSYFQSAVLAPTSGFHKFFYSSVKSSELLTAETSLNEKPLQKPIPQNFDEQIDAILAAAPDAFASIRGAEIKKDLGSFAAFARPEYESEVFLEGSVSSVITQDNFNQISWTARFKSYAGEAEAQKQFATLEEKLRKHTSYPFGEARFTPVRDARGTLFYVEPKAPSDVRYKGLVMTLALMKGLENVEGKLEQRYQTTLTINYR